MSSLNVNDDVKRYSLAGHQKPENCLELSRTPEGDVGDQSVCSHPSSAPDQMTLEFQNSETRDQMLEVVTAELKNYTDLMDWLVVPARKFSENEQPRLGNGYLA